MKKMIWPVFCWSLLMVSGSVSRAQFLAPEKQPYNYQAVTDLNGDDLRLADLDNKGFTEIITIHRSLSGTPGRSFIMVMNFEGKIIEQVNVLGRIVNGTSTLDMNADGFLEILVPFVRNDSLFVSFVDHQGEKLFYFFLIDGKPRFQDGSSFNWDPSVRSFHVCDLDSNGSQELISVVTTDYARLPRGILVHSLPEGKLISKCITGSPPRENFLDDFDGDGTMEILYLGMAPDNGANAGGFDDSHSYLIRFALTPYVHVINSKRISEKFSNYSLFYDDFNADGQKELLACTEFASDRIPAELMIARIDPENFRADKISSLSPTLTIKAAINLNRDPQMEIIAVRDPGEIVIFKHNFEEIKKRKFPISITSIKILPDIDDDGIEEIVVNTRDGDLLLEPNLKIKATFPARRCLGLVKRDAQNPPWLMLGGTNHFKLVQLRANKFYLVQRYYGIVLYVLGGLALLAGGIIFFKTRARQRILSQVQSLAIDSDCRGLMLFDHKRKIHMMNQTLRTLLGLNGLKKPSVDDVFASLPAVLTFIHESIARPPRRQEKTETFTREGNLRQVQIILEPVTGKSRDKSYWLMTLCDQSSENERAQAQTWCKMAQKTAHDIKNPLSAIMLTLQRFQIRMLEHHPEVSSEVDPIVSRVIERIESLRRISKNFMKFVNIESLHLVSTEMNSFLADAANFIRPGLPPDIQLQLHMPASLPMIKIDTDAMRSVLENLVANAVNAMPNGGQITIAGQFTPGLTFPGNGKVSRDYVAIEVMDTGVGIPETDRAQLFDPGFTTLENGNGLGLALVKKTVDDHAGHIEVESEVGAGTTFCIYLPAN